MAEARRGPFLPDQVAQRAEAVTSWRTGMCQQFTRSMAGFPALYPDAATAWRHAVNPHPGDRYPPRGALVYWTGGRKGYGHAAISLGAGMIRSTDAGAAGRVGTLPLLYVEQRWGHRYAGWAEGCNGLIVPDLGPPNRVQLARKLYREANGLLAGTPPTRKAVHAALDKHFRVGLRQLPKS